MEQRTSMYTGDARLKSIASFLAGYGYALDKLNAKNDFGIGIHFFDWIANKLGYYESTPGWANMILASSIGLNPRNVNWSEYERNISSVQHLESIKLFYSLLDDYIKEFGFNEEKNDA